MNNMWDQRFSAKEYVYGEEPNAFFKEKLDMLAPGRLLLPAEGEGRNAVYAASRAWEVTAFDSSAVGKEKAERLARKHGVSFRYQLASFENIDLEEHSFDAIALVYAHHPLRASVHRKVLSYLKPGGYVILEGFSKEQLRYGTGGPNRMEMLFSNEEISTDFFELSDLEVRTVLIELDEGLFHKGTASVVRMTGKK